MTSPQTPDRAGRPPGRRTGRLGRWALRCGAVAVVVSGAGVVPVLGADAAPAPVTPTAQTIDVPVVDDAPSGTPSSSASTGAATPSQGATSSKSAAPSASATPPEATSSTSSAGPTSQFAPPRTSTPSASPEEPVEELATGPVRTRDFNMVSVQWDGDPEADVSVEVRVRTDDGWSRWQPLEVEDSAPDPGTAEARGAADQGATTPLWVSGGADAVDVRVSVPEGAQTSDGGPAVTDVRASLIDPKTGAPAAKPSARPFATANAAAASMPGVITRAQWGADEQLRLAKCSSPSYTSTPKVAFVHHTAGSNTYTREESAAIVRGIYYQHTVVQGWCDIGYNFLVDKYGQVFEGRFGGMDKAVLGAHAGGFNAGSFGVSVLGNYETAGAPAAATDALARVIAWKFGLSQTDPTGKGVLTSAGIGGTNTRYAAGTQVALNAISGHRDVGSTACPGVNLYSKLPSLRAKVAQLMQEKEWELRSTATPGASDATAYFGDPGGVALSCDWDGDGTDGTAVYTAGRWSIRQSVGSGGPDLVFGYGSATMVPVCGDWNGDGTAGIGVYDPSTHTWWLRETASPGEPDRRFSYGFKGVKPVTGDWDGNGRDGIGVYDGYRWWLRGSATPGGAGAVFSYGWPQATPVTGDWDGDGRDTIGVYATGAWWLRDSITPGQPDSLFGYGAATDRPVVGRWDLSGVSSSGAPDPSAAPGTDDGGTLGATEPSHRGDGVAVWRTWP